MTTHLSIVYICFFAAICLNLLATFGARTIAEKFSIYARSDNRRRHDRRTPLLGGIGFYILVEALIFIAWAGGFPGTFHLTTRAALCFAAAITLVFALGVWDDISELKAGPKFAIEILAAILVLIADSELPILIRQDFLPPSVVGFVMIIWILGITNSLNFIDGLDGLCTGIAGISAITMALIPIAQGAAPSFFTLLMAVLAGGCIGFLFHNFNPAKIFLGDSGSLLLGFILAITSVTVETKRSLFVSLSLPILVLSLPLFDMAFAIVRRTHRGNSIFKGDRGHVHHRLRQMGLSDRQTVLLLWGITIYLNAAAYFLTQIPVRHASYLYAAIMPPIALLFYAFHFVEKRLGQHVSQYGHLFLREQQSLFADKRAISHFLKKRRSHFYLVLVDCKTYLRELAEENPQKVVQFYMDLYAVVQDQIRNTDLIFRVSQYELAVVITLEKGFHKSETAAAQRVIDRILNRIKENVRVLQEKHHVFLNNPDQPEGVKILKYPEDIDSIKTIFKFA